nr:MAG TPA: hypothetical protein [Caudoviricetes sp.]
MPLSINFRFVRKMILSAYVMDSKIKPFGYVVFM